jgi:hypothetical protein
MTTKTKPKQVPIHWQVLFNGSFDFGCSYELSVIRSDNTQGQSWGYGGPTKIILFSNGLGGNTIGQRSRENIDFAQNATKLLCEALNSVIISTEKNKEPETKEEPQ